VTPRDFFCAIETNRRPICSLAAGVRTVANPRERRDSVMAEATKGAKNTADARKPSGLELDCPYCSERTCITIDLNDLRTGIVCHGCSDSFSVDEAIDHLTADANDLNTRLASWQDVSILIQEILKRCECSQ
jgi:hypothetical protein